MGVNLAKSFDNTLANTTLTSSNTIPLTMSQPNSLFEDDTEDDYLYDDSEGINFTYPLLAFI